MTKRITVCMRHVNQVEWLHLSLEEGTEKNDWDYTNDYT